MLLVVLLLLSAPAAAHGTSRSTSVWTFGAQAVRVRVSVPLLEVVRARPEARGRAVADVLADEGIADWLRTYVPGHLRLPDGCAARAVIIGPDTSTALGVAIDATCTGTPARRARVDLFFDTAPAHLHLARFEGEDVVLTAGHRTLEVDRAEPGIVLAGAAHVLAGWDHLAFVVTLLLLGGGLLGVATIVTGFTLGHSLSLAAAALGLVSPESAPVETLVALSIAYVALEYFHASGGPRWRVPVVNLGVHAAAAAATGSLLAVGGSALFTSCHLALHRADRPTVRLRTAVAALFGLVHGLAFAGAFAELLDERPTLGTLLGFNLGVELAQLLVVAIAAAGFLLLGRVAGPRGLAASRGLVAATVLALGVALAT